jgi:hypothetical protein
MQPVLRYFVIQMSYSISSATTFVMQILNVLHIITIPFKKHAVILVLMLIYIHQKEYCFLLDNNRHIYIMDRVWKHVLLG